MAATAEQALKDRIKQQSEQILILSVERDQAQKNYEAINKQMVARLPISPFTDRRISNAYQDLCESIEDWVDMKCGNIQDFAIKFDGGAWDALDKLLVIQMLDHGATIDVARTYPQCSTYILMRLVMRFLFERMLRRSRWLPGMSEDQETLLNQSFGHMCDTFPARDSESRAAGRCDFYTSLIQSTYLQNRCDDFLQQNGTQLLRIINKFTDRVGATDEKGLQKILSAAVELAKMIRLCPAMYYLIHEFAPQMPPESCQLEVTRFKNNMVIDAKHGTSTQGLAKPNVDQSRIEGRILSTVFPSLVKVTADGGIIRIARGLVIAEIQEQAATPMRSQDGQILPTEV